MARRIPVAFDVLGTCYSLDAAVTAIVTAFGAETLAARNVNPALVVEDWFHTSQRDFTYLSMNDTYFPIFKVFSANLPRILSIAGLAPPVSATVDSKSLPCAVSTFSPEFLAPILTTLTAMTPRPSLSGCSALLSATSKFRLLAATNGGAASTRGLYINALGPEIGGEGPKGQWGVFSCDTAQVAKPAPAVYENIWTRFETDAAAAGEVNAPREGWFVASHTWDLHAAKLAGFKTAWVSYEEHITCEEIYGRPDIVAADLEEAARRIIEWEQKAGTI